MAIIVLKAMHIGVGDLEVFEIKTKKVASLRIASQYNSERIEQ